MSAHHRLSRSTLGLDSYPVISTDFILQDALKYDQPPLSWRLVAEYAT